MHLDDTHTGRCACSAANRRTLVTMGTRVVATCRHARHQGTHVHTCHAEPPPCALVHPRSASECPSAGCAPQCARAVRARSARAGTRTLRAPCRPPYPTVSCIFIFHPFTRRAAQQPTGCGITCTCIQLEKTVCIRRHVTQPLAGTPCTPLSSPAGQLNNGDNGGDSRQDGVVPGQPG